jgi:UDP-glucose 4-epimerase
MENYVTVLLTGGLGHIGSRLIGDLLKEDDIVIIDSLATQRYSSLFNLNTKHKLRILAQECQTVDMSQIRRLGSISSIVHLAAHNEIRMFEKSPETLRENNFSSTKWANAVAAKLGIPLIFPSSTSVYNRTGHDLSESETGEAPISIYARVKKEEELFLQTANDNGSKNTILRLGTIYGTSPGMRFHTAINNFCWNHSIGRPIDIWGNSLTLVRPYLALSDAVSGIKRVINSKTDLPALINLVSENLALFQVIELLERVSGRKVQLNHVMEQPSSTLSFSVSNKLAISQKFTFTQSVEDGVKETMTLLKGIDQ